MPDNPMLLITGGSGSLGHALIPEAIRLGFERIILFSRNEYLQHLTAEKFREESRFLRFFLGDVRDFERLKEALSLGVTHVIHAAALKHVPGAEADPTEAVHTNVLGALNVVKACRETDSVTTCLGISSDKACAPLNAYGASKLLMEKIFLAASSEKDFLCTRYGNVINSAGSVLHRFLACREKGQPLALTNPGMTRFWMTLEEAAGCVGKALFSGFGGSVLIPKLPGFKVMDLAEALAPGETRKILGIRPGEKLDESLYSEDESLWVEESPAWFRLSTLGKLSGNPFLMGSDCNSGTAHRLALPEIKERLAAMRIETP